MTLTDIWTPAIVLFGFQLTAFAWRMGREVAVADEGRDKWLPPADLLNMIAMSVNVIGVFIAPGSFGVSHIMAMKIFSVSLILSGAYPFVLAGHYELYSAGKRSFDRFPKQEKIALVATTVALVAFLVAAFTI
jgi:hypothetical protein